MTSLSTEHYIPNNPGQEVLPQPMAGPICGQHRGLQQPQQPPLRYFITRSNGCIVPLVPVDELPYSVRLEGAPRNISADKTFGMQFLGTLPYTGMLFTAKGEAPGMHRTSSQPATSGHQRQFSNSKKYMAPDALARQATANVNQYTHTNSVSQDGMGAPSWRPTPSSPSPPGTAEGAPARPLTDPQAIIDAIVSSKAGAEAAARTGYVPKSSSPAVPPPSGKVPDANKKTHCSYWIRTGECDYAQQGCMFKHEMPDEKGLLELGFRSTPRWWVEKNQAIRLGGGVGGKKATVGPPMKPSEWLRKASLATTESDEESGSESEAESADSKVQKEAQKPADTKEGSKKSLTLLKKPAQEEKTPALRAPIEATPPAATDNLIDFDSAEETASSAGTPTATPPTSAESSPRMLSSPPKVPVPGPSTPAIKAKKGVFVPKGESKAKHFADHASRQQRSPSRRSPKPSAAQVESLDKQIQRAQKSKHLAVAEQKRGLSASMHAPSSRNNAAKGDGSPKKSGRNAMGLRVRKPAPVCVEVPTGTVMKERAAAAGKVRDVK